MASKWVVETEITRASLEDDGIIYVRYPNPSSQETLEEAKYVLSEMKKHTEGKTYPAIIDLSIIRSVAGDARSFHAGKETAEVVSAAALIIKNPISKAIGNFFLSLNRPIYPVQLFTSEEDAREWLKSYLNHG